MCGLEQRTFQRFKLEASSVEEGVKDMFVFYMVNKLLGALLQYTTFSEEVCSSSSAEVCCLPVYSDQVCWSQENWMES